GQLLTDSRQLAGPILQQHAHDFLLLVGDAGRVQRRPRRLGFIGDDADEDACADRHPRDRSDVDAISRQSGCDAPELARSIIELNGEVGHVDSSFTARPLRPRSETQRLGNGARAHAADEAVEVCGVVSAGMMNHAPRYATTPSTMQPGTTVKTAQTSRTT